MSSLATGKQTHRKKDLEKLSNARTLTSSVSVLNHIQVLHMRVQHTGIHPYISRAEYMESMNLPMRFRNTFHIYPYPHVLVRGSTAVERTTE